VEVDMTQIPEGSFPFYACATMPQSNKGE
jgi:hypothetical protein